MKIPYYHIDAFADKPFTGNPAGVCILDSWLEDFLLQRIAAENNLSETAFVVPEGDSFGLRWFSPTIEIDLCGHATLATAFVLDMTGKVSCWPLHFSTKSGILSVSKENDLYFLDFPARPAHPCSPPAELIKGLGITPQKTLKSRDYLAILNDQDQVLNLEPDMASLAGLDSLGIIVTAAGNDVDFVSRFFAPGAGVPEDPVTGSSHCSLIPYWADQTGKQHMIAKQLSQRGGKLICENCEQRVRIGGKAVLYHSGTIHI